MAIFSGDHPGLLSTFLTLRAASSWHLVHRSEGVLEGKITLSCVLTGMLNMLLPSTLVKFKKREMFGCLRDVKGLSRSRRLGTVKV